MSKTAWPEAWVRDGDEIESPEGSRVTMTRCRAREERAQGPVDVLWWDVAGHISAAFHRQAARHARVLAWTLHALEKGEDPAEQVERLAAERDAARTEAEELRLTLAAEQGRPEGAPSARWTCDGRTWRAAREDGGLDTVELHAIPHGDGTVQMVRIWTRADRFGFEFSEGRFTTARAAMLAADAAHDRGTT